MSFPRSPRAVVTGCGAGLGRAFCLELAARGARVFASDVDVDAARATAGQCSGGQVYAVCCDVAKLTDVEALAAAAHERLGGVDLVVNNARVAVSGRVGEISIADWQWLLGINLWGVIHGCHVFAPSLRRQGSGHILNVASLPAWCTCRRSRRTTSPRRGWSRCRRRCASSSPATASA